MKSKKWLIVNLICAVAIVCSTLFVSSLFNKEAEPEGTDAYGNESSVDIDFPDIAFPDKIDSKGKEAMLEYNNFLAGRYGGFDIEYNKDLSYDQDTMIDGLYIDYYFDDSGFGMVVYSEYPGMNKKYDLVWRTTDFGKTWTMNPEQESALVCSEIERCGAHLFSTYYHSVSMVGLVVHSDNYGETFEHFLPSDVFEQLGFEVSENSGLNEEISLDILSIDKEKKQIFLSITDKDMDGNKTLVFVGRFDTDLKLIEKIYFDKAYADKLN